MRRPIATWGTLRGVGPFVRETQDESLVLPQAFMGTVEIMALRAPTSSRNAVPTILKRVGRGEGVDRLETVGADGRRVDVTVTVSPIRDAKGRIVGASSIARDIAHRKEAEAAVRERDVLRVCRQPRRCGRARDQQSTGCRHGTCPSPGRRGEREGSWMPFRGYRRSSFE